MSENIQKGDLVYVAKISSCGCYGHFGYIFSAGEEIIHPIGTFFRCNSCGYAGFLANAAHYISDGGIQHFHKSVLRKIPPLSELESIEIEAETT